MNAKEEIDQLVSIVGAKPLLALIRTHGEFQRDADDNVTAIGYEVEQPENETAVLEDAARIVTEREAANGDPTQSMKTITNLWNAYLGDEHPDLTHAQGAMLLGLLKVGRQRHGDNSLDDPRDLAGYAELVARLTEYEKETEDAGVPDL